MTVALALLAAAAPAVAPAPPPPVAPTLVRTGDDSAERMTVPVRVNGQGPFRFVVDTGADRTVIAREVAERLALPAGPTVVLHAMAGVSEVPTVRLGQLAVGDSRPKGIEAAALGAADIGAEGLLGVDSLQGRRVVLDFAHGTMAIGVAPPEVQLPGDGETIVVTARSRFGQLILVDADVSGTPVTVIIDTGAQNTIGNAPLRALLEKRQKLTFIPTLFVDVAGGTMPAELAIANRIRIGGLHMNNLAIAFADAHPFRRFAINDRPAMLLGMSTLRAFRRVSVDFRKREVRFLLPGES